MELKINLATASLKDAEHAIFIIGAYFGMTSLPTAPSATVSVRLPVAAAAAVVANPAGAAGVLQNAVDNGTAAQSAAALGNEDPAATFAPPAVLPPGAGEAPMTADPAAVFASGNAAGGATAPVGPVLPQTPAPSAPIAAAPVGTPPAPAPAPVASAPPVELDADGLPWDNRIHASGEGGAKPKNKDGRWRAKRGLNDGALVKRVQDELRAAMAAPLAPQAPPAAPTVPPAASLAPAPGVAPSAPVGPQPDPTTFTQLMPRFTAAVAAKQVPQDALITAAQAYGVPTVPALAARPDVIAAVWTYLKACYPAMANA